MDPYVLDTPWWLRRLIVSTFILPFRPKKSALAYASIWTEQGSPLLVLSASLAKQLQHLLAQPLALAMRYGQPSIDDAVKDLLDQGVQHIVVAPLYPQHADSTVTTSVQAVTNAVNNRAGDAISIGVLPPFYAASEHIDALQRSIANHLPTPFDHLLFSYHGLPERHITRSDPTGKHCLQSGDCCTTPSQAHATCYRHQALTTSRLVAEALGLEASKYSVSFQSRLGRLPWLTPYTDQTLAELPSQGVSHLAVVCPAFVADNLETLEEISIQGRQIFQEAGGKSLTLIPCLNDDPLWVHGLASLLERYTTAAIVDTSA